MITTKIEITNFAKITSIVIEGFQQNSDHERYLKIAYKLANIEFSRFLHTKFQIPTAWGLRYQPEFILYFILT